jgi:hypothetical protein
MSRRKTVRWLGEDILTKNLTLIALSHGFVCLLLASFSFPERALQTLIRFQFQLWFHVESDLSKTSGINAGEMKQTPENARKVEAVLHYMTKF